MSSSRTQPGLFLILAGLWANNAVAQGGSDAVDIAQAFRDGRFDLEFQHRYEHVDQDGFDRNANASVLRTRLTFETTRLRGFSLTAEVDDLRAIGADGFNSTRNGKIEYPVVADSTAVDLNRLSISHSSPNGLTVVLGRQRLTASSRRYVGSLNWRVNEQTFDAISAQRRFANGIEASYSYVANVNRVFGPKAGNPPGDLRGAIHLLHANRRLENGTRFWGYGYFLDFDTAADISTATVGARVEGALRIRDGLRAPFIVDVARQRNHADNPFDFSVDYWLLEGGLAWTDFSVHAAIESLGGTGRTGESFSTPLAGLHGQNGWADQFLATPAGGLEDRSLRFHSPLGSGTLDVVYHDYSATAGSSGYGTELDVSANWPISEHLSLMVRAADYRAEGFATDVTKFWVMVTARF